MGAHVTDLSGKVAVVTGGASGIGLAMARSFGAAGAKLMLGDIEQAALEHAVDKLTGEGFDVDGEKCDVSRWEDVDALAARTYERYGAAHIVCNNAGVVTFKPTWEQTLADWNWVLGVDLMGVVHGVKAFVPRMIASGEPGHVVNTSSTAGILGFPLIAPYVAAKMAVVGLSETLLNDLNAAGHAIGVSVLCPGAVRTGIRNSERNRPGHDSVVSSGGTMESKETLDPEAVAALVLDGIRTGTFWLFPHQRYVDMFSTRAESAKLRIDPPVPWVDR
jgi:NAD(P)-dependent dehydrogenase (short-subunit alcohol dehydrogenase family)